MSGASSPCSIWSCTKGQGRGPKVQLNRVSGQTDHPRDAEEPVPGTSGSRRRRQGGSRMRRASAAFLMATLGVAISAAPSFAQGKKPNILVMFGDDVGYWNVSAYNRGMMGYRTPNIDRIAKE